MKISNKEKIIASIAGFLILASGLTVWLVMSNKSIKPVEEPPVVVVEPVKNACEYRRKLDGVCSESEPFAFAVSLDNHVNARPQYGLADASLVYETIVETPITRILAFFYLDKDLPKVGPIRSARRFFVDWVSEMQVPFLHVGGSPEALNMLSGYKFDINEMASGQYFWRDLKRYAPHNAFSSGSLIDKALNNKDWKATLEKKESELGIWHFKDEEKLESRPEKQTVKINYKTFEYNVEWRYDREQNDYVRYLRGVIYKDGTGKEIRAKNLALVYTDVSVIDNYGRLLIRTSGTGTSSVFVDGREIKARWEKKATDRMRFYTAETNEEISFNAGMTWINIISKDYPKAEVVN